MLCRWGAAAHCMQAVHVARGAAVKARTGVSLPL